MGLLLLSVFAWGEIPAHCLNHSWLKISGRDSRGRFSGAVDFWDVITRKDGFTRVIDYEDAVRVFDNRRLSWVIQGRVQDGKLYGELQYRDFVTEAEGVRRTTSDPLVVPFTGTLDFSPQCEAKVKFEIQIQKQSWEEIWRPSDLPASVAPFTGFQRTVAPAMEEFNSFERWTINRLFSSFHSLAEVAPYRNHPRFIEARDYAITDKTDFDFYRAYPNRIRIRAKLIDPISLAEEKPRADAFAPTLARKAEMAEERIWEKIFNPVSKTLGGGTLRDGLWRSNYDGALWQGMLVAAHYFQYKVMRDPKLLNRIEALLEGLIWMQEIVPTPGEFARTLRPHRDDDPNARWHRGTGDFHNLDWLDGGNNDMQKGLLIGLTYGYYALCHPIDYSSQCPRIRKNVQRLADHVRVKIVSDNLLLSTWLAAWVTKPNPAVSKAYAEKAARYWRWEKSVLQEVAENVILYGQGDWSGLNLHLTAKLVMDVLDRESPLPVSRPGSVREAIQRMVRSFTVASEKMRYANWLVAGSGWLRDSEARRLDAIWRLREIPLPKIQAAVDHRLHPDFSVSPIPSHPWKSDWDRENRIKDYRYKPFFEVGYTDWILKDDSKGFVFDTREFESSPGDYFFLYWLARYLDVISVND